MKQLLCIALVLLAGTATAAPDINQVNGAVSLQADQAAGRISTVNGSVHIGERASAEAVSTVNGRIQIGAGARIKADASAVNGTVVVDRDAEIGGKVSSINGRIQLHGARVAGRIETVMGVVEIGADSRVDGGLLVRKPRGLSFADSQSEPTPVIIGPRATVGGTLRFERAVRLYVSSSARVGTIEGATPVSFSGDQPPGW